MEIIPNWHPVLVHFTIALYVISALLFAARYFLAHKGWPQKLTGAAYINLWLGALITVLTVGAGIYAYNTVGHDTPSHLAMTDHRNWALGSALFLWAVAIWAVLNYRAGKNISLVFVVAMLVGAGMMGITGFKGGELVYRYGLGVMSLPQVGGEGHSHDHADGAAHDHGAPTAPKALDDSQAESHSHADGVAHDHGAPAAPAAPATPVAPVAPATPKAHDDSQAESHSHADGAAHDHAAPAAPIAPATPKAHDDSGTEPHSHDAPKTDDGHGHDH